MGALCRFVVLSVHSTNWCAAGDLAGRGTFAALPPPASSCKTSALQTPQMCGLNVAFVVDAVLLRALTLCTIELLELRVLLWCE